MMIKQKKNKNLFRIENDDDNKTENEIINLKDTAFGGSFENSNGKYKKKIYFKTSFTSSVSNNFLSNNVELREK